MKSSDVESSEDLARFVREMRNDLQSGASYWHNAELGLFLEQLAFWTETNLHQFFAKSGISAEEMNR
jgi:hypothetical protein